MTLLTAATGTPYRIADIHTGDAEMDAFLLSLGCYADAPITVISHLRGGCVVSIKDGRYTLGRELAQSIQIR